MIPPLETAIWRFFITLMVIVFLVLLVKIRNTIDKLKSDIATLNKVVSGLSDNKHLSELISGQSEASSGER